METREGSRKIDDLEKKGDRSLCLETPPDDIIKTLKEAKRKGFEHLSCISIVDWPEKKQFEVDYHLWSYKEGMLLTVKTFVDHDEAKIESVVGLWGANAEAHEREAHELFGIIFKGNKNLTPLFLKDWKGPYPFRRDFNWREFVDEKYFKNRKKI